MKEVSIIIVLDLSPAIDTIYHNILINHLEKLVCLYDSVLNSFKMYIKREDVLIPALEIMCLTNMTAVLGLQRGTALQLHYSHCICCHWVTSTECTMFVSIVTEMMQNCTLLMSQIMIMICALLLNVFQQ